MEKEPALPARWVSSDVAPRSAVCTSPLEAVEETIGCAVAAANATPALPQLSTAAAITTKRPPAPPAGVGKNVEKVGEISAAEVRGVPGSAPPAAVSAVTEAQGSTPLSEGISPSGHAPLASIAALVSTRKLNDHVGSGIWPPARAAAPATPAATPAPHPDSASASSAVKSAPCARAHAGDAGLSGKTTPQSPAPPPPVATLARPAAPVATCASCASVAEESGYVEARAVAAHASGGMPQPSANESTPYHPSDVSVSGVITVWPDEG